MGWPAQDPEGYDKVMVNAIILKLDACLVEMGIGEGYEAVREALTMIQGEAPAAFEALLLWAIDKLPEAETDYLTRCVR